MYLDAFRRREARAWAAQRSTSLPAAGRVNLEFRHAPAGMLPRGLPDANESRVLRRQRYAQPRGSRRTEQCKKCSRGAAALPDFKELLAVYRHVDGEPAWEIS